MIGPEDIVKYELIGLDAYVIESSNPYNIGISGKVIDETKNLLLIERRNGKISKIIKKDCVFLFTIPSGKHVKINGELIVGRPEDRIKIRKRKK